VLDFSEDLSDLSAISYARKDVNDQNCAIIKIFTNLDALYFETRLGIEGDIVNKTGEHWIYVSPKEKQLKIIKKGFIPLEYAIPLNIAESKVYKITLTGGSNEENNQNSNSLTEFVVIETEPEGAQIYINDQLKGISPITFPLQEGKYSCRIEKALYKTDEFDFNLVGGNTLRINKSLTELDIFGNISISSDSFAEIYIDNKNVGIENYSGRLIEGLHVIKIEAENYKTYKKDILIIANRDYLIEENLIVKLGFISVQSEPMGASIFIDGEFTGTTPRFIREIRVGNRQISIEKEGYATFKETIKVEYDKTREYIYTLSQARKFSLSSKPAGAEVYLNDVLIGTTPIEFDVDYSNHNKLKIVKDGYHTVFDELPKESELTNKSYNLEKLSLATSLNTRSSNTTPQPVNNKSRRSNHDINRTALGWSISGLNARPGGVNSSIYFNVGNISQYGIFLDGGYQFNNYNNNYIDGVVNFTRFTIGGSYNLWLSDIVVLEAFLGYGREYATGLSWEIYDIWDYPPDMVYTKFFKLGLRAGVRISPHAELFGAYNLNYTDGPAYDVFGDQAEINGVKYNYQTIFPDRDSENWEIGIRFVLY
jgi:hypothetical protein